jgi:hypothetical protein
MKLDGLGGGNEQPWGGAVPSSTVLVAAIVHRQDRETGGEGFNMANPLQQRELGKNRLSAFDRTFRNKKETIYDNETCRDY